jgi:hypothetical protein
MSEANSHEKQLTLDDIELLLHQGLIADIRNKLSGTLTLLYLLEESSKTTAEGIQAKEYLSKHQGEMVACAKNSIGHILGALSYCATVSPNDLQREHSLLHGERI